MAIWKPGDLVQSYITGHWYQLIHLRNQGWIVTPVDRCVGVPPTVFILPRKAICARCPKQEGT